MSDPSPLPADAAALPKPSLGERLQLLVAEYGRIGIWIYGVMYVITFAIFVTLALGAPVEPGAGRWAVFGVAYAGFKLTQPFRILAAVALTPPIARWVRKSANPPPAAPPNDTPNA